MRGFSSSRDAGTSKSNPWRRLLSLEFAALLFFFFFFDSVVSKETRQGEVFDIVPCHVIHRPLLSPWKNNIKNWKITHGRSEGLDLMQVESGRKKEKTHK
jgi:hypothetical protein